MHEYAFDDHQWQTLSSIRVITVAELEVRQYTAVVYRLGSVPINMINTGDRVPEHPSCLVQSL